MVDSTVYGDVMGSVWQIGVIGATTLKMFDGPSNTTVAATVGDKYYECGIMAVGDQRGMIDHQSVQFSRGLEVAIMNQEWEKRLSANSSIRVLSLQGIRENKVKRPLVIGTDNEPREPSTTEKCMVLGNKQWRNAVLVSERAGIDTLRRSTPISLWNEIIGELCDGFMYTIRSQSSEEGDIDADTYGFQHYAWGSEETNTDETQKYWPEPVFQARHAAGEEEANQWENRRDDHCRTGLFPSNRRASCKPNLEECALERYMENRREYGPLPDAKWGGVN